MSSTLADNTFRIGSLRQSQLASRTMKEQVKEEPSVNAQLLMRAGFVEKTMAGVYSFLPLGMRVLQKVEHVVRQEMTAIGSQEILLPALHPQELWTTTGRWDEVDVLFKLKSRHADREYALGPTHEEVVTPLLRSRIQSYKDLPLSVFQLQTKFRDEPRARSGLLRGREFRMKDMYSFHASQQDLDAYYEIARGAYERVFERLGIGDRTYFTFASGGAFSKYSHEFQTVCATGEDTVYLAKEQRIAVNREIYEEVRAHPEFQGLTFEETRAIEVGNIFKLGSRFSEPFGVQFVDEQGNAHPVLMGCYGIGPSRLVGALVEVHHDERGIRWPMSVAPFQVHVISLARNEEELAPATEIFEQLTRRGFEVLFDDRIGVMAGAKFADSDLLGIPVRMVVSSKTLAQESVEVKRRESSDAQLVKRAELDRWEP